MSTTRIPIAGPWITDHEIQYVADAAARAWYDEAGTYVRRFEQAFADRLGVAHAVAVPHCTSAIHLALVALGVGPGDEVIVPELTWIASSAPIDYVGARPVFADVDPQTWCLDLDSFARSLTPRTRAVIVVDLYGGMPEIDSLVRLARQRGVAVIEDAAEALGPQGHNRPAGAWGDVGVFSFHGSKTMTTGEGGMLVTDRDDVSERVPFLRDHGRRPGDVSFCNEEVAFKYRMSDTQAALGLAQLERLDQLVARKREIYRWYRAELADLGELSWNEELSGFRNSYWMTTVLFSPASGIDKFTAMRWLDAQGIATRPFFQPLSALPAYRHAASATGAAERNRVAYELSPRGLNLPSALCLSRDDVRRVSAAVRQLLAGSSWARVA